MLDVRWIASVTNRFTDRLSRTWDPSVPQCTRAMTAFLSSSLKSFVGRGMVFRYRMGGCKHPMTQKKQTEAVLGKWWGDEENRFFNLQPELLGLTLRKI